jgi:hypothetical protein
MDFRQLDDQVSQSGFFDGVLTSPLMAGPGDDEDFCNVPSGVPGTAAASAFLLHSQHTFSDSMDNDGRAGGGLPFELFRPGDGFRPGDDGDGDGDGAAAAAGEAHVSLLTGYAAESALSKTLPARLGRERTKGPDTKVARPKSRSSSAERRRSDPNLFFAVTDVEPALPAGAAGGAPTAPVGQITLEIERIDTPGVPRGARTIKTSLSRPSSSESLASLASDQDCGSLTAAEKLGHKVREWLEKRRNLKMEQQVRYESRQLKLKNGQRDEKGRFATGKSPRTPTSASTDTSPRPVLSPGISPREDELQDLGAASSNSLPDLGAK